VSCWYKTAK